MIKGIIFFMFVWALVYFSIQAVRIMKAQEQWSTLKSLIYSACCASVAVGIIAAIVAIF